MVYKFLCRFSPSPLSTFYLPIINQSTHVKLDYQTFKHKYYYVQESNRVSAIGSKYQQATMSYYRPGSYYQGGHGCYPGEGFIDFGQYSNSGGRPNGGEYYIGDARHPFLNWQPADQWYLGDRQGWGNPMLIGTGLMCPGCSMMLANEESLNRQIARGCVGRWLMNVSRKGGKTGREKGLLHKGRNLLGLAR